MIVQVEQNTVVALGIVMMIGVVDVVVFG